MDIFDKVWNKFESLIEEKKSCSICMKELIEILKPEMSNKTFDELIKLDFQTESNLVREHIITELRNKPLTENIKGVWFGITKFSDTYKNNEYNAFYIAGSKKYCVENIDWISELDYETNNKIFLLETMNEIDLLIQKDNKLKEIGDWIMPISYYSFIINQCFLDREFKTSFLQNKDEIGIAIGYDEGDYINLTIKK